MIMSLSQTQSDERTHIVSILAILFGILGVNAIEFYFDQKILGTDFFFLVIQNVVGFAGMSYYAIKFAITPNSVSIQTDPTKK